MKDAVKQSLKALAIHDLSCFGRCSLTVALPIISASGINCSALPTSILSTHTGGFSSPYRHDLSDDILPIAQHWHDEGVTFDGIYTGYLGSVRQTEIIPEVFRLLKNQNTKIVIDPVLGDNGTLYKSISPEMTKGMRAFARHADILLPNITEACALADIEYEKAPHRPEFIEQILTKLGEICDNVVLKGIMYDDKKIGTILYHNKTHKRYFTDLIDTNGACHGSGDIFASVLVGKMLCGDDIYDAMRHAADFTKIVIQNSIENNYIGREGLCFEQELDRLSPRTKGGF